MPPTTPADDGATKAPAPGKRSSAPAPQQTPQDAVETAAVDETTDAGRAVEDTAPEPEVPTPGWFRNTAATELTVIPNQYPSARLAPGQATWLPDDPRHPNLVRCDAPEPGADAADTAGSEK